MEAKERQVERKVAILGLASPIMDDTIYSGIVHRDADGLISEEQVAEHRFIP